MTKIEEIKAEIAKLQEKVERLEAEAAKQDDECPKKGDMFYCIDECGRAVGYSWERNSNDIASASIGNCFRTREEAEFAVERLKVLVEMRKFAVKSQSNDGAYILTYFKLQDGVFPRDIVSSRSEQKISYGVPEFKYLQRAYDCIAAIGEERLKKYWFGVKDDEIE